MMVTQTINGIFLISFFLVQSFSYIDFLVLVYSLSKSLLRIKDTFMCRNGLLRTNRPWWNFIQALILIFFIFFILWYRLIFYFMLYNIIFFIIYFVLGFFGICITKKQYRRFNHFCFTPSRVISDWAEWKMGYSASVAETLYVRIHDCAQLFSCLEKLVIIIIVTPLLGYVTLKNNKLIFLSNTKYKNKEVIKGVLKHTFHFFIIINYWSFSFSFFSLLLTIKVIIYLLSSSNPLFDFTDSSYELKSGYLSNLL